MTESTDATRSNGRISIVIPTHDRANLLEAAILSVLSSPLITSSEQIIVVDDDSHDRTRDVAEQYGVRYLWVAHHKTSASRNAGFGEIQTPYVTFLDEDDAWLPGNMEAQIAALDAHPYAGYSYGIVQCASEDLKPLPLSYPSPPLFSGLGPEQLHRAYPQFGVVLFRREAVAEVGGFDERFGQSLPVDDADLMLRIAARREIIGVDIVGALFRMRQASMARSDLFWSRRAVSKWRPKDVGLGWSDQAAYIFRGSGIFCHRFFQDAAACAALGARWDATICLSRALRVSPVHALRHPCRLGSVAWRILRGKKAGRKPAGVGIYI